MLVEMVRNTHWRKGPINAANPEAALWAIREQLLVNRLVGKVYFLFFQRDAKLKSLGEKFNVDWPSSEATHPMDWEEVFNYIGFSEDSERDFAWFDFSKQFGESTADISFLDTILGSWSILLDGEVPDPMSTIANFPLREGEREVHFMGSIARARAENLMEALGGELRPLTEDDSVPQRSSYHRGTRDMLLVDPRIGLEHKSDLDEALQACHQKGKGQSVLMGDLPSFLVPDAAERSRRLLL